MKFDTNLDKLAYSATLKINEESRRRVLNGSNIYKWGFGQSPFPVPSPMIAALQEFAHHKDYLNVQGLLELRESIASFYLNKNGITYSANEVVIGPGSKQLIFQLLQVLEGPLLLPTPSWVTYGPQANMLNKKVIKIPTLKQNEYKITAKLLIEYCSNLDYQQFILILNSPNNPVGHVYNDTELKEIAEVGAKYNLVIISDEIYADLQFEGPYSSIASVYENTIVTSGISKWVEAGGWRLGYCLVPPTQNDLLKLLNKVASETYTSVSAPIQYASVKAFENLPSVIKYKNKSVLILSKIAAYLHHELAQLDIESPKAQGGFYLFIDFEQLKDKLHKKSITSSAALCEEILNKTGVALLPGVAFFRSSEELTARLAYVDFDGKQSLKLTEKEIHSMGNEQFVKQYAPNMYEGLRALERWRYFL